MLTVAPNKEYRLFLCQWHEAGKIPDYGMNKPQFIVTLSRICQEIQFVCEVYGKLTDSEVLNSERPRMCTALAPASATARWVLMRRRSTKHFYASSSKTGCILQIFFAEAVPNVI